MNEKPVLGILLGDSCGVGPELIAKLCEKNSINQYCRPIIIGDARVLEMGKQQAGVDFEVQAIKDVSEAKWNGKNHPILDQENVDTTKIKVGKINAISGKAAGDMLMTALELCKKDKLDGFAFAPLNKAALKESGYKFESENKLFGHYFDVESTCELNVLDDLWTSRVTSHVPVEDIAKNLSVDKIVEMIKLVHTVVKNTGKDNPIIGVAALNPHCGENGTCGTEEIQIIQPAIKKAQAEGINAVGPFSADILFIKAFNKEFDAVVTMFHDQGQIALKLKGFQYGITVHGNLPVAIATAAHGSAFDIAGKGIATTDAMENAIKMSAKIAKGLRK